MADFAIIMGAALVGALVAYRLRLPVLLGYLEAGIIKAGTSAALRFEVQGIINGQPVIVAEHVTRMHDSIAPEWAQGHGYRLIIEGRPRMICAFDFEDEHGDTAVGGVILTATRIVNAIPAVCSAPPGFLTELDLPLITGKGLMA